MKINVSKLPSFPTRRSSDLVAIIGLLAAIAIPNFVRARTTSQANACINNLRQYDGAVQQYALEQKLASTASYTMSLIQPYVKLTSAGVLPTCPANGTYSPGTTVTNPPTCSLSGSVPAHALP